MVPTEKIAVNFVKTDVTISVIKIRATLFVTAVVGETLVIRHVLRSVIKIHVILSQAIVIIVLLDIMEENVTKNVLLGVKIFVT